MNAADTETTILGIDPGLNITGYGVLRNTIQGLVITEAGVVRTKRKSLPERLATIYDGICEVIETLQPDCVAVEELYSHYAHPRTAILMGHARGVICLAAEKSGTPVYHYAATQIKKILTGNGHASKTQMQLAICHEFKLPEPPEPADVADALAIALCHFHQSRISKAI
jgi:crossover junction endodeoxyribonuclease RuvC